MSFKPERDPGSVKSLLALLRLSQDEAPAVAPHKPRPNAGSVTRPTSSPQAFSAAPSPPRPAPSPIARPQRPGPDPTDFQPEVPSQRNLQELIETLRKQNEEYQRPHPTSKNSGDVPLSPSPSRSLQGSSPSTEQVPQVRRLSITKTSVALPPNAAASTLQASPQHAGSSLQHGSPASRGASAGDANVITGSQRIHLRQSTVSPTKRRKVDNDEGFQRKDAPLKSALKRPTVAPTHTSEASSSLQSSRAGAGASTATHSAPNRRSRPRSLKPLDPSVSPEFRSMPFSKALPIVSGLIGDDAFLGELRKMKADQDALERTLWTERQGVTRALMAQVQRAKEVSSSRFGNSISASTDRKAELKASLDAHHVDRCLPAWDDMGRDQQIKLEAMGVPGLGNEDQEMDDQAREAMFERRNKVMALLEGVMAEG